MWCSLDAWHVQINPLPVFAALKKRRQTQVPPRWQRSSSVTTQQEESSSWLIQGNSTVFPTSMAKQEASVRAIYLSPVIHSISSISGSFRGCLWRYLDNSYRLPDLPNSRLVDHLHHRHAVLPFLEIQGREICTCHLLIPSCTAFCNSPCCRHLLLGCNHPFLTAFLLTIEVEPMPPTSDHSNLLKQYMQLLAVLASACANVKWQEKHGYGD